MLVDAACLSDKFVGLYNCDNIYKVQAKKCANGTFPFIQM